MYILAKMAALLLLVTIVVVCCDPITIRPTPEPPPPPDLCEQACARWQLAKCKEGQEVCAEFSDVTGECNRAMRCAEACRATPQAYPDPVCVLDREGESCEAMRERCFQ